MLAEAIAIDLSPYIQWGLTAILAAVVLILLVIAFRKQLPSRTISTRRPKASRPWRTIRGRVG